MKYKFILFMCLFGFICIGLTSCESCSHKVELIISDMGLGDWDINGDGDAGREISFKGKAVKNSCNIRSHKCSYGIDSNRDGWCDNCKNNGFNCHMVNHQSK